MFRKAGLFILLFLMVTGVVNLSFAAPKYQRVCFKETCFKVELAVLPEERERGLMFRQSLPEDAGMLFVFEGEDRRSFWSKNTLIPLDIIWIDKNKKAVFIKNNALPCKGPNLCPSIDPPCPAMYVLELNAGTADKFGLRIGSKLKFD